MVFLYYLIIAKLYKYENFILSAIGYIVSIKFFL